MRLEVSIGEAIDKLSILELKLEKIQDPKKRVEIEKEIKELAEPCRKYRRNHYYKILMHINREIWEKTDIIKASTPIYPHFASIANKIFELNQERFRIKNIFNMSYDSALKEQKSYRENTCFLVAKDVQTIYDKIPEIIYLTTQYEQVLLPESYRNICTKIFLGWYPTIEFSDILVGTILDLDVGEFAIPDRSLYDLPPISYISCGFLGDFILQLSVVKEKFLETRRRGIVYLMRDEDITDNQSKFRFGVKRAYEDTYEMVRGQSYIEDYLIYDPATADPDQRYLNLSIWRDNPEIYDTNNWYNIFKFHYGVKWGTHPWLEPVREVPDLRHRVLINTTPTRRVHNIDFVELCRKYEGRVYFITNREEDYEDFKATYLGGFAATPPPLLLIDSLLDTFHVIASCELFVGSLSAYLTLAHALHRVPHIVGLTYEGCTDNVRMSGLDAYIPTLRYAI